jgi:putative transposase
VKCYKTELDPNNSQRTALLRHAGAARVAYNWGLQKKIEARQAGAKSPTAIDLHKELNALKKVSKAEGGFPWMYEVSKCAPQEALRHLDRAFEGFFRRCRSGKGKPGFPKFKSRKKGIGSFTLAGAIHTREKAIQIPRLGVLRLKEADYFPSNTRIISATVSEKAGHWFVSIQTDEMPFRSLGTEILGCDVGIKSMAVLSDGTIFENPKALKVAEDRLRILQKDVSRKHKGSRNRKKAVQRLARQHYRVSCIRKDAIHKATSAIAKRTMLLGIESLNVSGMMKNHCLARSLSDAGLAEFHRQLEYKMKWAGGRVVKADRFFPSSKTCSACGFVKQGLTLGEREWVCPACNARHDRDVNAAINLRDLAVSSTVAACCPGSSDSFGSETSGWAGTERQIRSCPKWVSFGER